MSLPSLTFLFLLCILIHLLPSRLPPTTAHASIKPPKLPNPLLLRHLLPTPLLSIIHHAPDIENHLFHFRDVMSSDAAITAIEHFDALCEDRGNAFV